MSLLNSWSDVLPELLANLTDHQKNALELSLDRAGMVIGATSLKNYNFESLEQFILCLASAQNSAKAYLQARYGITKVADLVIDDIPSHTHEAALIERNKAPASRPKKGPMTSEAKHKLSVVMKAKYQTHPELLNKKPKTQVIKSLVSKKKRSV